MNWWNALLLFLLIAGHTSLLVTLVNRVHGLPLPCRTLKNLRHIHDLLIPLFPIILVWFVGLTGPKLLLGGSWHEVSLGWRLYLCLCAAGTLGLLWASVRYLTHRPPRQQRASRSEVVDIAKELGGPPLGEGPLLWLAKTPCNEIFQVEFSHHTFVLPRLPREWDGLSILHLSDWHMVGTLDKPFFERVTEMCLEHTSDLVIFSGDLLDRQECEEWLPETLGRIHGRLGQYYILGNHDWYLRDQEIRNHMHALGWHDLASQVIHIPYEGRTLAIGGDETPWMGQPPRFDDAAQHDFRLLVCHTPDNIGRARRDGVDLMLSGHNHGGQVNLPVIGPVYSPSIYGSRYSGGAFWESPTLMYVSRGLSGRHPLRLRCRPEITRLTLKSPEPATT
ncbi:phosphodiesterase YaeI [Maioricimonas rarisocia]|uniref:Phosphodiesterase YaeI n=1 Tax=Maioricimonas rarisocia TaxID=2528026 RepID=A0A517Z416_9PLAN|nr:metallophosphoesterase [Maioricimonas rarisocia]QDU37230.1 phosphodiesterase YaeI [Maioricimonas rarisocia]